MKVTLRHFLYFWLVNSFMAAGTGFVIGIMAFSYGGILIESLISFPVVSFVIYQFYIFSYFYGKRRGEFEYSFLEKSAMCGEQGQELKVRLKEVRQELKWGDPASAHAKLTTALKKYPENFVVRFKYSVSCERMGRGEDAITAYKKTESLIPVPSSALKCYVAKQATRVKKNGPLKRSSTPGLQYVLY